MENIVDITILRLRPNVFESLVNALNESENWKKIANCINESEQFFSPADICQFSRQPSPAKRFLEELDTKMCTVAVLGQLLERCGLVSALSIISKPTPLRIIQQPENFITCYNGDSIVLKCVATGNPIPTYQWLRGNTIVSTENQFKIESVQFEHAGMYRCKVQNNISEIWTVTSNLIVYSKDSGRCRPSQKLSIVIGNQNYIHIKDLSTVKKDADTFCKILEKLGFETKMMINQTKTQIMNSFRDICESLQSDAYVVLYYAGHGFELREKYLLPVDCSEIYTLSEGISERQIMHDILETKPALFVMLLDMCLQIPSKDDNPAIHEEIGELYPLNLNRNLVCGYSTSSDQKSYERSDVGSSVYMKYLQRSLLKDLPIVTILNTVNHDIVYESSRAAYFQMPTITYNTIQDHYLTDPIKEFSDSSSDYTTVTDDISNSNNSYVTTESQNSS